jgi:tRNA-2-methylthio-N6-dimethylallyladenosine synthase
MARERLLRLQALLLDQTEIFNLAQVGKVLPVLFEKPGRNRRQAIGRSPYLQSVHVEDALDRIGEIHPVRIVSAGNNSLAGALAHAREVA